MKGSGLYPRVRIDSAGTAIVSQGGAVGLVATVGVAGLDRELSQALAPWRKPNAVHDPGKIVADLALPLAVGGDCLADIGVLQDQPAVFGLVASDPTVSWLVDTLAADARKSLAAIDTAGAVVRARVWSLAGEHAPDHGASVDAPVIIDLDAALLTAHCDKELAAPTFKRGFGFHPLLSFLDHGADAAVSRCLHAASGQRRVEHRGRPHRRRPGRVRATARAPTRTPAWQDSADPHRRRRCDPRIPELADRAAGSVLDRVHAAHRLRRPPDDPEPGRCLVPGARRR